MRRSGASVGAGGVFSGRSAVGLGKGRGSREYSMAPAARPTAMTAFVRPREPLLACTPAEFLVTEVPDEVVLLALICPCEQPVARAATRAAAAKVFTGPF
jgi:hypothetical protein